MRDVNAEIQEKHATKATEATFVVQQPKPICKDHALVLVDLLNFKEAAQDLKKLLNSDF